MKYILVFTFFLMSAKAFAIQDLYKLLKIRNIFKIEDFKTIAEITKKEYKILPSLAIRRSFLSKDKENGDIIDNYIKENENWEHVILFDSLDEFFLKKSNLDSVRFIRAKRLFSKGKYQEAIKEIRSMNKGGHIYARSLYLLGLMFLYNNQYEASRDAFRGCVRLFEKLNKKLGEAKKLLNMFILDKCQIAESRVFFKEKKFDDAKESYKKIPIQSHQWPESILELGWVFYLENEIPKSFTRNLTLENQSFYKFMFAENRLLAILNLQKNCFYKQALDLATKTVDEYNLILKDLSRYEKLSIENRWKLFEGDLLKTPYITSRKEVVAKIDHDLNVLKKLPQTIVKKTFYQELNKARDSIVGNMNEFVKRQIKRKYLSISRNIEDILSLKLSIISKIKTEGNTKMKTKLKKQTGKIKWRFNNEYWPDEINDVSVNLGNRCI